MMKKIKDILKNPYRKNNLIIITAYFITVFLILCVVVSNANDDADNNVNGAVLNITDVSFLIHDEDDNYSENNEYYSGGVLKFDVLTNGSIHKYTTNIKLYNSDKLLSTYTNSPSEDNLLHSGINHITLNLDNLGTDSEFSPYLPKNGTITDIVITLEANNNKLFETPKINVGSFTLRYYETPNPNYKT